MDIKKFLFGSFIATSLAFGFSIEEVPSIEQRVSPDLSKGSIYSYAPSIKDAKSAVVNIATQKRVSNPYLNQNQLFNENPLFRHFFGDIFGDILPQERLERSLGSGVIITKDGYIVTNNHVIEDADTIIVALPNSSKEYVAKIIGKDPKSDLAVIKIEEKNLQTIKFANSDELMVGDLVFAIGNPFGIGESVTMGIVSALNKSGIGISDYENFIQTDASINPGNSGGALVDSRGALVGINTAILSKTGGNHGVGFAIPTEMVKNIVSTLVEKGRVDRGVMGVTIEDIKDEHKEFYKQSEGAIITSIVKDSSASKAGLKIWDLIVAIDGKKIKDSAHLRNTIGGYEPGKKIEVEYIRDKKRQKATLILGNMSDSANSELRGIIEGLALLELDLKTKERLQLPKSLEGVLVGEVEPNSEGYKMGFRSGDVILQVERYIIQNLDEFKNALNLLGSGAKRVLVYRRGYNITLIIR